jgi:hypothetical protein
VLAVSASGVVVHRLEARSDPARVSTQPLSNAPGFVHFLSDDVVGLFTGEAVTVVAFGQPPVTVSAIDGAFFGGKGCVRVLNGRQLWCVRLDLFQDRMERFSERSDYAAAIALWTAAMNEDPTATAGLLQSRLPRAHIIEYALSHVLREAAAARLQDPANAEATIDWLLGLAREFHMKDWIVTIALPLFRDMDLLRVYFAKIVQCDPDAATFRYTPEFVALLLENCEEIDAGHFLLSLRSRIAPIEKLLRFGLRPGQTRFLFEVYTKKLDDLIAGVSVLANIGDDAKIAEIICEELNNEETTPRKIALTRWVLARNGDAFPRLARFVALNDPAVFGAIGSDIQSTRKPIRFSEYVNIFIGVLDRVGVSQAGPFFKFVKMYVHQNEILPEKVRFGPGALAYIFGYVFAPAPAKVKDDREDLLLAILKLGMEAEVMKALIPMCESFAFLSAKKFIQTKAKIYDSYIKDALLDSQEDVYALINRLLDDVRPGDLKKAIVLNSSLLIVRSVTSYIDLVFAHFRDFHGEILDSLDDWIRHYYLHALFASDHGKGVVLHEPLAIAYATLLCDHFPDEVYPFMRSHDRYLFSDFIEVCSARGIFDACAFISQRTFSSKSTCGYLSDYLAAHLLSFADGWTVDIWTSLSAATGATGTAHFADRL